MKLILKRIYDIIFAVPSLKFAISFPSSRFISFMRKLKGIQMSTDQLCLITDTVNGKKYLELPLSNLEMSLSNEITSRNWDVIIDDAPVGVR